MTRQGRFLRRRERKRMDRLIGMNARDQKACFGNQPYWGFSNQFRNQMVDMLDKQKEEAKPKKEIKVITNNDRRNLIKNAEQRLRNPNLSKSEIKIIEEQIKEHRAEIDKDLKYKIQPKSGGKGR